MHRRSAGVAAIKQKNLAQVLRRLYLPWKFLPGTFVPWNSRSQELSFPGTFAPLSENEVELSLLTQIQVNNYRPINLIEADEIKERQHVV